MVKRLFLFCFAILFFVSLVSSWGRYDYLFFISLISLFLISAQLYLMVVMDRFYVGMGVELEKGWDDFDIKIQKIGVLVLYAFAALVSAFFRFF